MAEKPIGVGMIGYGFMGLAHRDGISLSKETELVAIAEKEGKAQANAATNYGVAQYQDAEAMVKDQLGNKEGARIFSILTPNNSHKSLFDMVMDNAKKKGVPVSIMCEKPMCLDTNEAQGIVDTVEQTNTPFALTHTYGQLSMALAMRDLIASGILGEIRGFDVEYLQGWLGNPKMTKEGIWRLDPLQSGLSCVFGDIGTHACYALEQMLPGYKIDDLEATLTRFFGRELENAASVNINMSPTAGTGGTINGDVKVSNVYQGYGNDLKIRIFGSEASIEYSLTRPEEVVVKKNGFRVTYVRDPNGGLALKNAEEDAPQGFFKGADDQGNPKAFSLSPAAREAEWLPGTHPGGGYVRSNGNYYTKLALQARAALAGEAIPQMDLPNHIIGANGVAQIEAVLKSDGLRLKQQYSRVAPIYLRPTG